MLELRRRIDEVHPEVVVCKDVETKEFAKKLLSGLGYEIRTVSEEEKESKLQWLKAKRAVWLGAGEPPKIGTCCFIFRYTGGA